MSEADKKEIELLEAEYLEVFLKANAIVKNHQCVNKSTGNIMVGFSHWFSVTGKVKQIIRMTSDIRGTSTLTELNEEDKIIDTEDCDGEKLSLRNSTRKYTVVKPGQCFLLHGSNSSWNCSSSSSSGGDFYNTESPNQRRCMMTAEGDVLLSLNADFGREDGNYSWLFRKMDGRAAQYSAKSNLLRNEKIKKMRNKSIDKPNTKDSNIKN